MTYDPFARPPQRADIQRSVLWTLQRGDHTYTCELKFWEDGGGTEALGCHYWRSSTNSSTVPANFGKRLLSTVLYPGAEARRVIATSVVKFLKLMPPPMSHTLHGVSQSQPPPPQRGQSLSGRRSVKRTRFERAINDRTA